MSEKKSPPVTEKDVLDFYGEKMAIVHAMEKKWKNVDLQVPVAGSVSETPQVPMSPTSADEITQKLEDVDRRFAERFGDKTFREAIEKFCARSGSQTAARRSDTRSLLESLRSTLSRSREEVLRTKQDLGKRLSEIKTRQKLARHGKIDEKI